MTSPPQRPQPRSDSGGMAHRRLIQGTLRAAWPSPIVSLTRVSYQKGRRRRWCSDLPPPVSGCLVGGGALALALKQILHVSSTKRAPLRPRNTPVDTQLGRCRRCCVLTAIQNIMLAAQGFVPLCQLKLLLF